MGDCGRPPTTTGIRKRPQAGSQPIGFDPEDFGCGITVGVARIGAGMGVAVGCDASSYGYKGDGGMYHNGVRFADVDAYGLGDVIGCRIDREKGQLIFTKNGQSLSALSRKPSNP